MNIAIDYQKYFKDRLIIITGCGRSGTTILGKLLGSMEPAYYLFEPAIMKYMPDSELLPAILFEDYLLPIVQGRSLNYNEEDDSYCGNYYRNKNFLRTRKEAVKFIKETKPFWIIKTNEISIYTKMEFELIFPGVKFIHIVRNGNDVINSALSKGWYSDNYMQNDIVDLVDKRADGNIPFYLDKEDKKRWKNWNQVERCSCVWRTIANSYPVYLTYESLLVKPEFWVDKLMIDFDLKNTSLTQKHIQDIKNHPISKYPSFIDFIEQPEKDKFRMAMIKFGYLKEDHE